MIDLFRHYSPRCMFRKHYRTACHRPGKWLIVTPDPARVNCPRCRRSRKFRRTLRMRGAR